MLLVIHRSKGRLQNFCQAVNIALLLSMISPAVRKLGVV